MKAGNKDVRKLPVHPALTKAPDSEKVLNRATLIESRVSLQPVERQALPKATKKKDKREYRGPLAGASSDRNQSVARDARRKRRLALVHEQMETMPAPCDTCKTSVCCYLYPTFLAKEEYESGAYRGNTIEITRGQANQLKNPLNYALVPESLLMRSRGKGSLYMLKRREDGACVYLGGDGKCTIYNERPISCRAYTCLGDKLIPEYLRDGSVPFNDAVEVIYAIGRKVRDNK